ncbi:aminotransferase class V-fold PLP-dependent enzyme [Cryobacterium sp. Sr8]|uniref:Selenocysteine lyase/Cysteine desulfurase n=1 Tax=Cryobacterium psychrotolerans TaxID=386301 RepID=A0A1G8XKX0_9MICO|nr:MULTISPECIES: aminotransferase class V-fold PLP-dependent enzyme [Cryobacterium]TFD44957.1 aminotransferase class V-fold PLP-dependent enzyme [Cryobacterium sp. TMT1-2-1]TFD80084.1 aminotransferase class V-fold PLP-dependent enzyme [Cryobacterium sp. Sr8]TFD82877.1 aminotransferase class V-fold PLP-dependent enzyme [Cryobacterium psychrotolerans]SDJ91057.1 Selenocysteine lyase/Cysteine desulfurase [Cryobacterium psychrotolerans]
MTSLQRFIDGFLEDPGYLDYGRVGPLASVVVAETLGQTEVLSRARFGSLDHLIEQDERLRAAVAAATGFRADQVVSQPNTSTGLMQALFGLTGDVLLSPHDFPSLPFAAVRAAEALHVVTPLWLDGEHERVTPGLVREQLTATTAAVAVCLVDARTGYRTDLEGIRQVIGDRLLIVDAIQGFGVTDAPYEVADVVASGGQKWARAGWGTGFLALSDRAVEMLTPVFSGFSGTDSPDLPWDEVLPPGCGAGAFQISNPDSSAQARFAAALEEITAVGVAGIEAAVTENVTRLIDLADEFSVPLASSRDERERAGIIVLEPMAEQLTLLTAALYNHGVTATTRGGRVRLSVHAALSPETIEMLRAAFTSYSTAASY